MHYVLFTIGPLTLYTYGLMIAIGIVMAFFTAIRRAPQYGLEKENVYNLGICAAIFGLLGAKLLYLIQELPEIIRDPSTITVFLSSGFVVYGGIILGILSAVIFCRRKHQPFFRYFDLLMPSIALAQGFGRIGCLMAGCCYGAETDGWCQITFKDSPLAPNGIPLIPTQLISSAADFLNFAVLVILSRRFRKNGQIGGLYLIFYSIGRFIIEFFRADYRGSVGILSTSQFISLFTVIIGFVLFFRARPDKAPESAQESSGKD